jgi:hydrogenase-4 component B
VTLELVFIAIGCYLAGGLIAFATPATPLARYFSAAAGTVGSLLLAVGAVVALTSPELTLQLPVSTPLGGFELRTNPLSGMFLLLTGVVGTAISVYSSDYVVHVGGPSRQANLLGLLNFTFATLAVLLASGNALTFLLAWESMSILTYVLVATEYDHPGTPQAAFLMLALSEIGFVAMAVGFALIGGFDPGRDFTAIAAGGLPASTASAAFVLFLFGFGAKAGLLPLQGWLPEAHPAAPSNISALLSAVVVKMAIYGLVLTAILILGTPPIWWGYLALGAGVITAVYGILFSLLEHDLKRALAFSTIENLGFMVAMIGAALIFKSLQMPALEALALVALTLHALNHAILKGGLFLGAGSVQTATGSRDMDRMGGLWRRMKWSGPAFFIAATGLAGIPPLNGFQSEWLGLMVLLQSHSLQGSGVRLVMAASAAVLALTFALAVTTYIRIVGGVFLGAGRSREAQHATEVPLTMRTATGLLAGAAVVLGLLPPLGIGAAAAAAQQVSGAPGVLDSVLPPVFLHPEQFALPVKLGGTFLSQVLPVNGLIVVPTDAGFSSIAPTYIFVSLAVVIALVALLLRLSGNRARHTEPVWAGAIPQWEPSMQYTATGFTNPLRFIFGTVYRSTRHIEGDYEQAPFFARTVRYRHTFIEPIEEYVYGPIVRSAQMVSQRLGIFQAGSVSLYLLYMFAVFLVALFLR